MSAHLPTKEQVLQQLQHQTEIWLMNASSEQILDHLALLHGMLADDLIDKLFEHMQDYRIELALEEVRRKTDVSPEPATLESIFTNRSVEVTGTEND